MKLTNRDRWRYDSRLVARRNIEAIRRRDRWVAVVRDALPDGEFDYLELGCAPGQYTAALAEGTQWNIFGIDYSQDAELFVKTLSVIGKNVQLFEFDMFDSRVERSFDIVTSFGLVEHFRGLSLDRVFHLHDSYLKVGGFIVIEIPNMTGFNYFWHYIFDRPDLDNHNIDVMQPVALSWFEERGYEIIFNDYVGTMRLWGNSGYLKHRLVGKAVAAVAVILSKLAKLLDATGINLEGRTFSPALLFIGRKRMLVSGESADSKVNNSVLMCQN